MEKKIVDIGCTVIVRFKNGPVLENSWEVLSEIYGRELDVETLGELVRKVENGVGYDYMTNKEREDEFWNVLKQGE
jgi:hypothetical protein